MIFGHQIKAFKLSVHRRANASMIKDIIVHGTESRDERAEALGGPELPESVLAILRNEKLMSAVFSALAFARNDHRTSKNNDDVGVFIFSNNDSSYSFRHRGPLAAEGLQGGQDFGGLGRHRVMGSAGLAISVTQLDSIRNGRLRSADIITYYKTISERGRMPVFVNSRGDFKSMMMYHYSYEGAIQIAY